MNSISEHHVHLVSDATGETVTNMARACIAQFDDIKVIEHTWPLIRTDKQMDQVIEAISVSQGIVLNTLVNTDLRLRLEEGCRQLKVTCIPLLDPVVASLAGYFGREASGRPGRQHILDTDYYNRIDAMHFALNHDDGQATWDIGDADVVVFGVSRTSKTPVCIYLSHRGIKAANVPVVPGIPIAPEIENMKGALMVGLTTDPRRLVQIRRNRLRMLNENEETDYVDMDTVVDEVRAAQRMYTSHGWPIIDVSRKSIEETAAAILQMLNRRRDGM